MGSSSEGEENVSDGKGNPAHVQIKEDGYIANALSILGHMAVDHWRQKVLEMALLICFWKRVVRKFRCL